MAGDWIKMRTNLDTDPAVVRISSGLKTDRYSIVGRLHKIWSWANEHLTDGQDVPVDAEFLDSLVETPGFSAELRRVGWLSGRDGSLIFPGFERHNGASAKARAQDAIRKRTVRIASEKCPVANRTKTGPEKRREEKRRDHTNKPSHPFLDDEGFAALFDAFKSSSSSVHNWFPGEEVFDSWLYDLTRFSIDEAKNILRLSTSAGAKKPILNGDSKPAFKNSKPKMGIVID